MRSTKTESLRFSKASLRRWRRYNDDCWHLEWWSGLGRDRTFLKIVRANSGKTLDCKLLYDAHLWRQLLSETSGYTRNGLIAELLPGASHTLVCALAGMRFQGRLVLFDRFRPAALRSVRSFPIGWRNADVLDPKTQIHEYDLVLGNHIFDDLLAARHLGSRRAREVYASPEEAERAWREISASSHLQHNIDEIISRLMTLAGGLNRRASLVLRQYPSTFALRNGDRRRIEVVQSAWSKACRALMSERRRWSARVPRLPSSMAPLGSRYPKSILLLDRR